MIFEVKKLHRDMEQLAGSGNKKSILFHNEGLFCVQKSSLNERRTI